MSALHQNFYLHSRLAKGNGRSLQTKIFKQPPCQIPNFSSCLCICLVWTSFLYPDSLQERLESHIHYSPSSENRVGLIQIKGKTEAINQGTWLYVKTALDFFKKERPIFVILELDTPGGEVFAAQKISDALKEFDTQENIPIVCVINNWAISAGAMLAYSCRFIAVVKDASMGAAEPVLQGAQGLTSASEKINSAIRADFANRAGFYNRNPSLAKAMVDKDEILVLREGKIRFLEKPESILSSDEVISNKGKLLTLTAEEMMHFGVADILLNPTQLTPLNSKEIESRRFPASKYILFSDDFFKKIPNATLVSFQKDFKTRFFIFLTDPMIASLLFFAMLVGFYLEFTAPGHGIGGSIGLISLMLIFLSGFALEAAGVFEIILIFAGLTLLLIDLFVIPSFGMIGIAGGIALTVGIFSLLLPGLQSIDYDSATHTLNSAGEYVLYRLAYLSLGLIGACIAIVFLSRFIKANHSFFKQFILSGGEQEGYVSSVPNQDLPPVGSMGMAITSLHPSGKVAIVGKFYQAMARDEMIAKGSAIKVKMIEGGTLIVTGEIN